MFQVPFNFVFPSLNWFWTDASQAKHRVGKVVGIGIHNSNSSITQQRWFSPRRLVPVNRGQSCNLLQSRRNKFAHKTVVTQWIHAFSWDVLALRPFHAYPHRFVGLVLSNCATGFPVLIELKSTRQCCWHRNFQLSASIFHCALGFFISKFNKENTT